MLRNLQAKVIERELSTCGVAAKWRDGMRRFLPSSAFDLEDVRAFLRDYRSRDLDYLKAARAFLIFLGDRASVEDAARLSMLHRRRVPGDLLLGLGRALGYELRRRAGFAILFSLRGRSLYRMDASHSGG